MLVLLKTDLVDTNTFMGKACDCCCDIMQWFSELFGITYYEINMYAFYILQPCIYLIFSVWGCRMLYRLSSRSGFIAGKISAVVMAVANIVMSGMLVSNFYGADFNALCPEKIEAFAASAAEWGISYSAWNLLVFAAFFILACIFQFVTVKLYRRGKMIPLFVWSWLMFLLSPLLIFVFFV